MVEMKPTDLPNYDSHGNHDVPIKRTKLFDYWLRRSVPETVDSLTLQDGFTETFLDYKHYPSLWHYSLHLTYESSLSHDNTNPEFSIYAKFNPKGSLEITWAIWMFDSYCNDGAQFDFDDFPIMKKFNKRTVKGYLQCCDLFCKLVGFK